MQTYSMCLECGGWFPISEFGARVLGLNPLLPLWIAASHRNILMDILWETLEPGCGLGRRDDYQRVIIGGICQKGFEYETAYSWLETNNPAYAEIIRSYQDHGYEEFDKDERIMIDLRGMFVNTGELRESGSVLLESELRLWTGPDQQEIHLRIGKVNMLRSNLKPECITNSEVQKFIRFLIE